MATLFSLLAIAAIGSAWWVYQRRRRNKLAEELNSAREMKITYEKKSADLNRARDQGLDWALLHLWTSLRTNYERGGVDKEEFDPELVFDSIVISWPRMAYNILIHYIRLPDSEIRSQTLSPNGKWSVARYNGSGKSYFICQRSLGLADFAGAQ